MPNSSPKVAVPIRRGIDGNVLATGNFPKVLACLRHVGLTPHIVTDPVHAELPDISAVVIPGGGDIDPRRYGGDNTANVYGVDSNQDSLDFWLVNHALANDLPLLGICRGAQVINVARGGTLYEDLPPGSQPHHNDITTRRDAGVFVHHGVTVDRGSAVSGSLAGVERVTVPSAHHQCVRVLGNGLRVVARADDNTVEAFEGTTGWLLAVQWHPEADTSSQRQKYGQFEALATAITARREEK